ncbi:MAG: hypothetical protein Harvfovirus28_15 [Harvfovirus sp.]|uniref:Uncharacterized protein n=1 Tax=Harvfovirus sp. TaxID=2487768 RepID=A0A3G5A2J1_9VIRU|nr:MAG: hypothetical protein Harvfovirus28_15 [Harvfovirus sp.]
MPFKSTKQRAACWAQYKRDTDAGVKPKWDCKEWEHETKQSRLPTYKRGGRSKSKRKSTSKKRSSKRRSKKKPSRRSRK